MHPPGAHRVRGSVARPWRRHPRQGEEVAELQGDGFRFASDGTVATVTLVRPEQHNAQTPALWRGLAGLRAEVEGVRVMVVRGEGKSFSSGLDRRMFTPEGIPGEVAFAALAAAPDDEFDAVVSGFQDGFSWLRDPSFISVAAVQGHAIGAGFQLALACDLRIVADDVQFSMREPSLGLVPDLGGTQPLVRAVGYSRALELCVTGRPMGAAEAVQCGLATAAVAVADLEAATAALVASLSVAPVGAVRATQALLLAADDHTYEEQLRAERTAQRGRLRALAGLE